MPNYLRPVVWLGRHATAAVAIAVFVGLIFQPLAALFKPLLVPAILLPFIVSLLRIEPRTLRHSVPRHLWLIILIWQLLGCTLLVWAASAILVPTGPIGGFLVTTAASAPLMASSAIALLLRLDVGIALAVTVAATLIVPLTLPPIALGLGGLDVSLDALSMALRLAALIGLSLLIAWVIRRVAGKVRLDRHQDFLAGWAVIGLAVFAIAVMDGARDLFAERPGFVAACALAAFALNAGLQLVTTLLFRLVVDLRRALTIGLVAGNNNIGIVLASAAGAASVEFAIYVAMAQFPIYLLPALQQRLYRRLIKENAG